MPSTNLSGKATYGELAGLSSRPKQCYPRVSSKIHLMPVQKNRDERSSGTGGTGDHTGPAVTEFLCLLLVHVSLNIPLGNELHRKVQDYIRWIKRFVNLEASRVIPGPRFTVVNQRELHGKTINA